MYVAHRTKVLLIGATGFIGSRILQALHALGGVHISILTRRSSHFLSCKCPLTTLVGDIRDPAFIRAAISQADVVINAASYIGHDAKMADDINYQGTLSVIQACQASNARRLVQVSTAAVYGSGPHRALNPWEAPYQAMSHASRSRAVADQAVLSAGGVVVRPNLVYGVGDRWFIPGAVRMFRILGSTIEAGNALLSTIDVTDLGQLVAALAVTPSPVAGAYHAAYREPISLARLLGAIDQQIAPLKIHGSSTIADAISRLEAAGFSAHQVHMLSLDHNYEAQRLWDLAQATSPRFEFSTETQAWYRSRLAST
jgi:nucleoside-diphosphate-sugar epimerase